MAHEIIQGSGGVRLVRTPCLRTNRLIYTSLGWHHAMLTIVDDVAARTPGLHVHW